MYISKEERVKLKAQKLGESIDDKDITVEVDGELIADTSEDKSEIIEAPKTQVAIAITDLISALLKDELEAIEGYNSTISTLRSTLEDSGVNDENIMQSIKVFEDIAGEEYMHIGQLQEVQKLFNPQVDLITKGEEEAKEQLETY